MVSRWEDFQTKSTYELQSHLPASTHPNYTLWRNYALFAHERGRLVADILQTFMQLKDARIIDIGCGVGGASLALAERGASVVAIDADEEKISALDNMTREQGLSVHAVAVLLEEFDERPNSFDAVVLQDVLEHLNNPVVSIRRINALLKPNGFLYISTPNRWSPLNILSDPHWNLPIVAMLPRKRVQFVVQKWLKRVEKEKTDLAALFSFSQLQRLLTRNGFEMQFVNRRVAEKMFSEPRCVLNSPCHLKMVAGIKRLGLHNLLLRLINDRCGVCNRVLNPTWYLVAQKLI